MENSPEYLKYENDLKKINILSIVLNILSMIITAQLFFLPIFIFSNMGISDKISFYNECKYCIDTVLDGKPEILLFSFIEITTLIDGISVFVLCLLEIFKDKNHTIFARIKNNVENKQKMTLLGTRTFFVFIIGIFGSILYEKLCLSYISDNPSIPKTFFLYLTGISPLSAIPIIMLVAWTITFFIKTSAQKSLTYKILSNEEQTKSQTAE